MSPTLAYLAHDRRDELGDDFFDRHRARQPIEHREGSQVTLGQKAGDIVAGGRQPAVVGARPGARDDPSGFGCPVARVEQTLHRPDPLDLVGGIAALAPLGAFRGRHAVPALPRPEGGRVDAGELCELADCESSEVFSHLC